jgi:Domain of Unknown Function (DUF1080)
MKRRLTDGVHLDVRGVNRSLFTGLRGLSKLRRTDTTVQSERCLALTVDMVVRLIRGEQLLALTHAVGVEPIILLAWRDTFLEAGRDRLAKLLDKDSKRPAAGRAQPRLPPRRRPSRAILLLGITSTVLAVLLVITVWSSRNLDDGWTTVHDGYGKVGIETAEDGQQVHFLSPIVAVAPEDTHAALEVKDRPLGDLQLDLRVRTVNQLRQGSPPNPWEAAWTVWHYTDDRHFYYLLLKPNGWELGKRDPAYPGGQRFLASDNVPIYHLNTWYQVRIVQVATTMKVWVNDLLLASFTDQERPYTSGRVGLYTEDAYAQFADVKARSAKPEHLLRPMKTS